MTDEHREEPSVPISPDEREQQVRDIIDKMAAASRPTLSKRDEPADKARAPESTKPDRPEARSEWWARLWGRKKKRSSGDAHSLKDYSSELAQLRFEDHQFDAKLKKGLGTTVIILLILQVALMNTGFGFYSYVEVIRRGNSLPDTVVIAWITSSIVQVVGLATVVAKYLFPGEGNNWANEPD